MCVGASPTHEMDSHLTIYFGPMFAGKTTHLLNDLYAYECLGKKTFYINSTKDSRSVSFSCHGSSSIHPNGNWIKTDSLETVVVDTEYEVIGVDECQFFSDLVPVVKRWLNQGKTIILSGLIGDYKQEIFGHLHELFHLADRIEKITAICRDCLDEGHMINNRASFNAKVSGDPTLVIEIGAEDKYKAVCRRHLF